MRRILPFFLLLLIPLICGVSMAQQSEKVDYENIKPLINLRPDLEGTYEDYVEEHSLKPYSAKTVRGEVMPLSTGVKVLVMVDSTLRPEIETRLQRYLNDLQNNGYAPTLIEVSGGTPADVKATIIANSTDLAGVAFIGDIPVAWYENSDDFDGNYASFPCEYFYMDLDGTWLDDDSDGMYDSFSAGSGDEEPEIFVGRIDASRMSAGEVEMTRRYFDKLHNYYTGVLDGNDYGLTYVEDDWQGYYDINNDIRFAYSSYQNIAGTTTTIQTERDDYLYNRLKTTTYEYIQLCCHSYSGGCSFTRGGWLYSTTVIAEVPQALFYNFFNCSGCRFTDTNYFGGAHIFNTSTRSLGGVGSAKTGSMLSFSAFYTPLGQGKSHGQAFKEWFAYIAPFTLNELRWHFGMALIGDPFLCPRKSYREYGLARTSYPKFQYDNQNSGFVDSAPVLDEPGLYWQLSLGTVTSEQKSSPVISEDGTIYVGSASDDAPGLYAVNPDGTQKWYFATEPVLSTPSIDLDGFIYFSTWNGTNEGNQIYCVRDEETSAAIEWQVDSDGGDNVISSMPLSDTGQCLYGTGVTDGQMIALNAIDGTEKWKQPAGGGVGASPALTHDDSLAVFASSESKMLYLVDTVTGTVYDSYETDDFMWLPSPCIGPDGTVYAGDNSGMIYALSIDGTSLELKWSYDTGGAVNGGIGAVYEKDGKNRLYVVDNSNGWLVAVRDDDTEGTLLWIYDIGSAVWTYNNANVLFDGTVYVGSTNSNFLYALKDMDTYAELLWQFSTGDPAKRLTGKGMAIDADGTIYCSSEDGNLYAIHETAVASVTVTSPNGGDIAMRGAVHTIQWETTGNILNVKIELLKGDVVLSTIVESALNYGAYDWEVSSTAVIDDDYRIRITDLDHSGVSDDSDGFFQIVSKENFFVTLDGSDETGTGRIDKPWRTVQHALVNCPSGTAQEKTVIQVGEGVFVEHAAGDPGSPDGVIFPYSGNPYGWTAKSNVIVRGAGMDRTVITTDAANQSGGGEARAVQIYGAGNSLEDLTVRHGIPQTGTWGAGIWTEAGRCQSNTVKNVRVDNPGSIGVCAYYLDSSANDILHVQYSLVNDAKYAGLFAGGNNNTCIVQHLTIADGKSGEGSGSGIVAATRIDVSYSIFANNASALKTIDSGEIHSMYNHFWQNTVNYDEGTADSIPIRMYDEYTDPLFFNPAGDEYYSFLLKNYSPAEGKGFAPDAVGSCDSDGDGMPDFWEELYSLDPDDPSDADDDGDGDNSPNRDEYYAGTDPCDPDSVFKMVDACLRFVDGKPTLEWNCEEGMYYAVLSYEGPYPAPYGFESWDAEVGDLTGGGESTLTWTDESYAAGSGKFYVVIVYGRE